jgi:hypothetical protein
VYGLGDVLRDLFCSKEIMPALTCLLWERFRDGRLIVALVVRPLRESVEVGVEGVEGGSLALNS